MNVRMDIKVSEKAREMSCSRALEAFVFFTADLHTYVYIIYIYIYIYNHIYI